MLLQSKIANFKLNILYDLIFILRVKRLELLQFKNYEFLRLTRLPVSAYSSWNFKFIIIQYCIIIGNIRE